MDWGALGTVGRGLVFAAIGFFAASVLAWALAGRRSPYATRAGAWAFGLGCASLFGAFAALVGLLLAGRFEYLYVFNHCALDLPWPYKLAGVWSGQQGSFLLWACAAAVFGLAPQRSLGAYRRGTTIVYALFLGALSVVLAYESPFSRLPGPAPENGLGLSPSLISPWLVAHPPVIFLGFGALTLLFALAVAALASGDLDGWIPTVRPWAVLASALLGLGLCLGGFWAYETLGWGGFWVWDPVENAGLVPWLACLAFVHAAFLKGGRPYHALLAGLPFLFFCYGTALTRSGILADASVHSYARMNPVALVVLAAMMTVSALGFLGVLVWRGRRTEPSAVARSPRERLLALGIGLLMAVAVVTAIGMSVPLKMVLSGQPPRNVGEAQYHRVMAWLFPPLMLAMAATPLLSLGATRRALADRLGNVLALSLAALGLAMVAAFNPAFGARPDPGARVTMPFGLQAPLLPWIGFLAWLCLFASVAAIARVRKGSLGAALSHLGLAVTLLGLIVSRGLERKADAMVGEGTPARALEYTVSLLGPTRGLTDPDNRVRFELVDDRGGTAVARPGLYFAETPEGREDPISRPGIVRGLSRDLYLTVHPPQRVAAEAVRLEVGIPGDLGGMPAVVTALRTVGVHGEPGFGLVADLRLSTPDGPVRLAPALKLDRAGVDSQAAPLGERYLAVLDRADPKDHAVWIRLDFAKPLYPIELTYKPWTALVWLGVGIMSLGGVAAAFERRAAHPARRKATDP